MNTEGKMDAFGDHAGPDVIWRGGEVEFYGVDREWLRDVEMEFELVFGVGANLERR